MRAVFQRVWFVVVLLLLAGCATGPMIDRSFTAKSHDSRAQFLILHYTALDFPTSLRVLTEQAVSSHYLVRDDPPTIYQLVDENRRAYHAGQSSWKGQTQINAASIGIEIVNLGFKKTPEGRTWFDYPAAQIDAVVALVKKIVAEHQILPERILGHSDIAPQRKTDPGPRFPWKRLADEGLIPWPDPVRVAALTAVYEKEIPSVQWFQEKLLEHGFAIAQNSEYGSAMVNVLAAFQMKYRPTKFDGVMDAETAAMLDVMTSLPNRVPLPTPVTASDEAPTHTH